MKVAHDPADLPRRPRAAVVGDFDGVHRAHRELLAAASAGRGGPVLAVVVDDPDEDGLLTTVERRLELLADAGAAEALVAESPPGPELLAALGASDVRRCGDAEAAVTALVRTHVGAGRVGEAAALLGRPPEVEGIVVAGDARGAGLGFPTANLALPERLLVPRLGIYAGRAVGHRAAISIGTNPTYGGGATVRVEAFLLDFDGDLYGQRLVVELWRRLRDEEAFASESALVAQIRRDVEETRAATRP